MSFLYWMIFGLIAGSIAYFISPKAKGGFFASVLLGIAGAVVGGWLGEMFFGVGVTGFNMQSFIVAVIGSLLLLFVGRLFTKGSSAATPPATPPTTPTVE